MIKEVFDSISEKMRIDFQQVTSMISHPGEKGSSRENALKNYLRPHIPDKFEFSEGIIVDSHDQQSCQIDMIIHDKIATPFLLDTSMKRVIPIESVYAIIEVKSTLTKDELRKSIKNVQSVRSLTKNTLNGQASPTLGFVFAYTTDSSLETVYKNLIELSKDVQIDQQVSAICILSEGLILSVQIANLSTIILNPSKDTIFAMYKNSNNSLLMFYLLLFQALNTIIVYPPNMMAYANSSEDFNTVISIPNDFLPDEARFPFLNRSVSGAEIKKKEEYAVRILRGELNRNDYLEYIFGYHIPSLINTFGSLQNAVGKGELILCGQKISNEEFVNMFLVFQKGKSATKEELARLEDFLQRLYSAYEEQRPAMKENSKMSKGVSISIINSLVSR